VGAHGSGHDFAKQNRCPPVGAQGIEAEIPQARRRRAEELQRKARFFYPEGFAAQILAGKKMRPNSPFEKFLIPNFSSLIVYSLLSNRSFRVY
jgi:hypothetical protein